MKYWNKERIKRMRRRENARYARAAQGYRLQRQKNRAYDPRDLRKNIRLICDMIGDPVNRTMLARLRTRGTMSVTHLAKPLRITLPAVLKRVELLERAGMIVTKKQGRIRYCTYRSHAARELSEWLRRNDPFDLD